jgi:hypothetical protein
MVEHGSSECDGRDEEWRAGDAVEIRQSETFDGQEDQDVQRCREERVVRGGAGRVREKEEERHARPGLEEVLTI